MRIAHRLFVYFDPEFLLVMKETHFDAGYLNYIVVVKFSSLCANGLAVHQRVFYFFTAFNNYDEVSFRATGNCRNLDTWAPECRQRLGEFEFTACE